MTRVNVLPKLPYQFPTIQSPLLLNLVPVYFQGLGSTGLPIDFPNFQFRSTCYCVYRRELLMMVQPGE
jgi:hypothetical protein